MLFSYRSGKSEPTLKVLRKLDAAEEAAGIIQSQSPEGESSKVREDPTPYRAELNVPLRPPGEPSLIEQIKRLDESREEAKRTMEEINAKLDSLLDLFKGGGS